MVGKHWKQWQREQPQEPTILPPIPTLQQVPRERRGDDNLEWDENEHKRISYAVRPQANIFEQYCVGDPIEGFKLTDWKELENKQSPLVQFALNHALPISISECERSFSSAKLTLHPLRSCMKSDLFEALETLRAWFLQDDEEKTTNNAERARLEELEVISKIFECEETIL
jgi:hAT family C-terminal dimerisation region